MAEHGLEPGRHKIDRDITMATTNFGLLASLLYEAKTPAKRHCFISYHHADDSWHTFFTVTRELVKDVPVNKFRRKETEEIVRLSIGVLNDGLRPHLTKWQARFRRWYGKATEHSDFIDQSPQEIQQKYPKYDELQADLLAVNQRLMAYRKMMYELVVFTKTKKH